MLSIARRLTAAQAGTVYAREAEGLRFLVAQNDTLAADLGHPRMVDMLTRTFLPWTERSIATYVALTQTPVRIPDAYRIPATKPYSFSPRVDTLTRFRTVSMLVLPLHTPIRGVVQLINAMDDEGRIVPFSDAAQAVAEHLASNAATIACAS